MALRPPRSWSEATEANSLPGALEAHVHIPCRFLAYSAGGR